MIEYEDVLFGDLFVELMSSPPRTGDPHVSDLIYCLRRSRVRRDFHLELPDTTEDEAARWASGLGWQELMESLIPRYGSEFWLPPRENLCEGTGLLWGDDGDSVECNGCNGCGKRRLSWNGIQYEPDAKVFETKRLPPGFDPAWSVWEIKFTRHSTVVRGKKKGEEDRPKMIADMGAYLDQLKSYCALENINRGRLVALHMCGDYSNGSITPPKMRSLVVEFEDEELEEQRQSLLHRKEIFEREEIPEPGPAWEGLCEDCVEGQLSNCSMYVNTAAAKEQRKREREAKKKETK